MAVNANSAVQSPTAEPSSKRRTVIKGAAWSLPVIAAAVAAPAASASDPVEERFEFNSSVSAPSVGGVVQDITFKGTNVLLQGPVGTSTGKITLLFTFPDGYTTWDPVAESFGWTVVEGFDADGFQIVTFTHPGVAVTTAGQDASIWFAGIVMHGRGASARNRAFCDYSCENYTGGGNYAP